MSNREKKLEDLVAHFLDLVDNRPEDMWDEEGEPTEELNRVAHAARRILER